jgi:chromosome segregation ATPase
MTTETPKSDPAPPADGSVAAAKDTFVRASAHETARLEIRIRELERLVVALSERTIQLRAAERRLAEAQTVLATLGAELADARRQLAEAPTRQKVAERQEKFGADIAEVLRHAQQVPADQWHDPAAELATTPPADQEIGAMAAVLGALTGLNPPAQDAVLSWVGRRVERDRQSKR